MELAIASSPGFSETGGPWVAPAGAVTKLTWSGTAVPGGERSVGALAPLPTPQVPVAGETAGGTALGDDLASTTLRVAAGPFGQAAAVVLACSTPQTVRSV